MCAMWDEHHYKQWHKMVPYNRQCDNRIGMCIQLLI